MIDEELDIPETDDDSFEALLAEKRHKELLAAFSKLAAAISDSNKGVDVSNAITQLSRNIEQFILKQKSPQVSVETNQDKVVGSVDDMGKKILQGLTELKAILSRAPEKKSWEFNITRDRAGYMEMIKAEQK